MHGKLLKCHYMLYIFSLDTFFNEILTMFVVVRINHDQTKKLPVMVENVLVGYHHDIYGQLHHTNCGSHNLGKFVFLFVCLFFAIGHLYL